MVDALRTLLPLALAALCALGAAAAAAEEAAQAAAEEAALAAAEEAAAAAVGTTRKCCPPGLEWERGRGCEGSAAGRAAEAAWRRLRPAEGAPACPDERPVRTRASLLTRTFRLQPDGTLLMKMPHALFPWVQLTADQYCLDTFVDGGVAHLDALVCFPEDAAAEDNTVATAGMLVSCVFLLLTLAVYMLVPELRNMHGRVLMAYLSSLLIGFLFLAAMQLLVRGHTGAPGQQLCVSFTLVIYFSLLAAFFWLNVMCFDIWWTFSGLGHVSRSHTFARRRYTAYCVYAFGFPSALTALLAALEFVDSDALPDYVVTPKLREQGCFLYGEEKLLYLYCPMLVLCIANALLFALTALRIARVRRQTAVLHHADSATHDPLHKDKQRLLLYVKLFVVMGVNWALEAVSALFPRVPVLWKLTDAYNVLIGFTVFLIFICKKKIFRLIKKRYDVVALGVQPSRSHTCSTRNASSVSREELRLPPLASPAATPAAATPAGCA